MRYRVLILVLLCVGVCGLLLSFGDYAKYPVNENGQTYGTESRLGRMPELLLVEATNGNTGYVLVSELENDDGSKVNNPSEAIEYMKEKEKAGPRVIDVYESDGETVIGKFEIY